MTQRRQAKVTRARARDWKPAFLKALVELRSAVAACEAAGVSRQTAYEHRQKFPEFAAAWAEADETITQQLEVEMLRRAHDGVEEPVFQGGKLVGTKRVYSDPLLMFALRAKRPNVYRDRTEVTGADGGPIRIQALEAIRDPELVRDATRLRTRIAQLQAPATPDEAA